MSESGETSIVRESREDPGRGVVRFPTSETLDPLGLPPGGAEGDVPWGATGVEGVAAAVDGVATGAAVTVSFETVEEMSADALSFRSTRVAGEDEESIGRADPGVDP